jgi:uncharacterized membrane protein YgcG
MPAATAPTSPSEEPPPLLPLPPHEPAVPPPIFVIKPTGNLASRIRCISSFALVAREMGVLLKVYWPTADNTPFVPEDLFQMTPPAVFSGDDHPPTTATPTNTPQPLFEWASVHTWDAARCRTDSLHLERIVPYIGGDYRYEAFNVRSLFTNAEAVQDAREQLGIGGTEATSAVELTASSVAGCQPGADGSEQNTEVEVDGEQEDAVDTTLSECQPNLTFCYTAKCTRELSERHQFVLDLHVPTFKSTYTSTLRQFRPRSVVLQRAEALRISNNLHATAALMGIYDACLKGAPKSVTTPIFLEKIQVHLNSTLEGRIVVVTNDTTPYQVFADNERVVVVKTVLEDGSGGLQGPLTNIGFEDQWVPLLLLQYMRVFHGSVRSASAAYVTEVPFCEGTLLQDSTDTSEKARREEQMLHPAPTPAVNGTAEGPISFDYTQLKTRISGCTSLPYGSATVQHLTCADYIAAPSQEDSTATSSPSSTTTPLSSGTSSSGMSSGMSSGTSSGTSFGTGGVTSFHTNTNGCCYQHPYYPGTNGGHAPAQYHTCPPPPPPGTSVATTTGTCAGSLPSDADHSVSVASMSSSSPTCSPPDCTPAHLRFPAYPYAPQDGSLAGMWYPPAR